MLEVNAVETYYDAWKGKGRERNEKTESHSILCLVVVSFSRP
jgi:hypothetical protein